MPLRPARSLLCSAALDPELNIFTASTGNLLPLVIPLQSFVWLVLLQQLGTPSEMVVYRRYVYCVLLGEFPISLNDDQVLIIFSCSPTLPYYAIR